MTGLVHARPGSGPFAIYDGAVSRRGQRAIPCVFMRGGTSRGPFFHSIDLPERVDVRDRVLLRVMGSPDVSQIDGLGGATTVTSKVAIVSRSDHPEADIDYLFAQVNLGRQIVDVSPTCGNMLSGVGPFAIEEGLIPAQGDVTKITIRDVNTNIFVDAIVQTPRGRVTYDGDIEIPGVPGAGAPIDLLFREIVGRRTGSLLPTGRPIEVINNTEATLIDVAIPMVVVTAKAMGLTGYETPPEIHHDVDFMRRMEAIRRRCGVLMGLGDVSESVLPKFAMVAPPREGAHFAMRYLTPSQCHQSIAVSGAISAASCANLPNSVLTSFVRLEDGPDDVVRIEHPSGVIDVELKSAVVGGQLTVTSARTVRTARRIMDGRVYVPLSTWPE